MSVKYAYFYISSKFIITPSWNYWITYSDNTPFFCHRHRQCFAVSLVWDYQYKGVLLLLLDYIRRHRPSSAECFPMLLHEIGAHQDTLFHTAGQVVKSVEAIHIWPASWQHSVACSEQDYFAVLSAKEHSGRNHRCPGIQEIVPEYRAFLSLVLRLRPHNTIFASK